MQDLDLASVPTDGADHEPTMYMEDTMWPIEGKYRLRRGIRGGLRKSIEHEADLDNPPFIRTRPGSSRRSVRMSVGRSRSCSGSSIKAVAGATHP
jgi:hypothetical protein